MKEGHIMNIDKWDRDALTSEEVDALIDATKNEVEHIALTFLADTGCRKNELILFRSSWCDFRIPPHGIIKIPVKTDYKPVPKNRQQNTKKPFKARGPKTKKIRRVQMSQRLSEILKEWFKDHDRIPISGSHLNTVCLRCAAKIGFTRLRVTPHIFRHTFVTEAFYKGNLDPEEIGEMVGHANGAMVRNTYLHIDELKRMNQLTKSGWLDR